jgi:signal peptidase II
MSKLNPSLVKWNLILGAIAALIIALDQWTKGLIQGNFYLGQSIPETGFFRLTYVQNTGAAFSIFLGGNDILAIFAILGVCLILFYNFYLTRRYPFLNTVFNKIAIALILGGTIGNLIDRLSLHYVRDFLDVGPWPIFNIADSSTVVGTIIFAVSILFFTRDPQTVKPAKNTDSTSPQPPADIK